MWCFRVLLFELQLIIHVWNTKPRTIPAKKEREKKKQNQTYFPQSSFIPKPPQFSTVRPKKTKEKETFTNRLFQIARKPASSAARFVLNFITILDPPLPSCACSVDSMDRQSRNKNHNLWTLRGSSLVFSSILLFSLLEYQLI